MSRNPTISRHTGFGRAMLSVLLAPTLVLIGSMSAFGQRDDSVPPELREENQLTTPSDRNKL